MTPVDLPEPAPHGYDRIVYTSRDPQVTPLTVMRAPDGTCYSEWELSPDELLRVMRGERLRLWIWTFGEPLQPVALGVVDSEEGSHGGAPDAPSRAH